MVRGSNVRTASAVHTLVETVSAAIGEFILRAHGVI